MNRTLMAALIAVSVMAVACDRDRKQQAGQPGAVGTTGHGEATVTEALESTKAPVFVTDDTEGTRLWKLTRQFYQKRSNRLAWIDDGKPRNQMNDLIKTLQAADREGLDPSLYSVSTLTGRREEAGRGFLTAKGFTAEEAARLDVWLTYLYLRYASDLSSGLSNLTHADPNWKISDEKVDLLALLEKSVDDNHVAESLQELTPTHAQYTGLRDALAKYRDIAQKGGWQAVPATIKIKPAQSNPAIPAIARRLAVTGDYTGTVDDHDTTYTAELQEAVKRFQRRHGLEPDGTIGASVAAQMNVPVEERVRQLALNLERWRWLPRDLGERHILVNVPEYRLEVWDHGQVPLTMRVVVGKKDTPTPIFNDDMTYVVFAPYWNVPADIVQKETLPSVMNDPAFLQRTNMEVLDKDGNTVDPSSVDLANPTAYRFRQRPGASNSLGLVKFMFPNQFNVYLHDTPADSLFARATRSFSHGCVRVEQPDKLAQYVLGDQPEWTPERIDEAMHAGTERTVKLKAPIPVYLGYWTARVSADGLVQFRGDLYGIDARQRTLLTTAVETMKKKADEAATAYGTAAQLSRAADRNPPASTTSRPQ
jgi:murein L,D-transpeptidase YcbB/YkuD